LNWSPLSVNTSFTSASLAPPVVPFPPPALCNPPLLGDPRSEEGEPPVRNRNRGRHTYNSIHLGIHMHIDIYIHTHTHTYIYIYVYIGLTRERERERER